MLKALTLTLLVLALPCRVTAGAGTGEKALVQVHFSATGTSLTDAARQTLLRAVAPLRTWPGSSLLIGGCAPGGEPARLHEARCAAVREFLLQNGFSPQRVRISSTCPLRRKATTPDAGQVTVYRE